ncbi:MAG: nucleotidyltransferase domain-containing protein [Nanoarchaeota archaeon]|nr:nucleotidyltransferase domain-containing protein [Nanoarchaeota archaeon]MBU1854947.1 nucleotidyltransferase domain-containing protein [Nanoarchaeota archaeon]
MLTKKQIEILSVFQGNLFAEYTFKQFKEKSKQKSNNIIHLALEEFKKQCIINSKKTGNVNTYMINLENSLTLAYLNIINTKKNCEAIIPHNIIKEIKKKINKKTVFFILTVFGSFAKGKPTEKSDLDIAVIVDSDTTRKEIIPIIETIKRREIQNIDYHIITQDEFKEMLNVDYENLGKQIYKSNIIYYGFIQYVNLIKSIKNE